MAIDYHSYEYFCYIGNNHELVKHTCDHYICAGWRYDLFNCCRLNKTTLCKVAVKDELCDNSKGDSLQKLSTPFPVKARLEKKNSTYFHPFLLLLHSPFKILLWKINTQHQPLALHFCKCLYMIVSNKSPSHNTRPDLVVFTLFKDVVLSHTDGLHNELNPLQVHEAVLC